ncbi:sulfotransferase [Marivita sp. GX14005]|uniref:tetratricopeptide repeat-containing sulfotransferase family protein n=1 Tax=Marivita sp. GX14005 TaxID=2942276 RepID=UPI0020189994|nr:sulfotransferase [Marivita sp. GX14005]MCL3881974.1 sulfotransferase [Marivita sp. GX14005]
MMQAHPQSMLKAGFDKAQRLAQSGALREAAALLDGLILQAPQNADLYLSRARLAARLGDSAKRQSAIDNALRLRPTDPAILSEGIATYTALGAHDDVLGLLDRQIALDPKAIKPQADKALYLQRAGRFDASEALFRRLLKKHPNDAELYRMFAATHRFTKSDPLIGAMRRLAKHPKLPPAGRMHINFALAKAMEDTGQHGRVFHHLRPANAAQAALWPDDPAARAAEWSGTVAAQDGLTQLADAPGTKPGLIFVTGLPRSGTTLVEQIIASHSQVQAGGEMATALRCAYASFGAGAAMRPLATATRDELIRFTRQLEQLNRPSAAQDTPRLTDKSIMAFLIYGLLHATLPNARFIIVHRDPRDIAVSIYKNHFSTGTHRYATDLAAIAEVIKSFRRITAHWRDTLPDRLTEIRYEDLVSDPEAGSRALIDGAGLDWEDRCLDFHKSGGTVKTLSLHQVRQPIYQSSAAAWRRYEAELQPFFDAWGDTSWD